MTRDAGVPGPAPAGQPGQWPAGSQRLAEDQRLAEGHRLTEEARRLREVPELDLVAFSAGPDGPLHAAELTRRAALATTALRTDLARLRRTVLILGVIIIALLIVLVVILLTRQHS
jgi:hypothetical protein